MWVLVIKVFGTLGSQRLSRILENTPDMISFMRVYCDTSDDSRGHRQIDMVLGNVFVQIPCPKNHHQQHIDSNHHIQPLLVLFTRIEIIVKDFGLSRIHYLTNSVGICTSLYFVLYRIQQFLI